MHHIPFHKRHPDHAQQGEIRARAAATEQFLSDVLGRHGFSEGIDRTRMHVIFCLRRAQGFDRLEDKSLRDTVKQRFWELWSYSCNKREADPRLCVAVTSALLYDRLNEAGGDPARLETLAKVSSALRDEVIGSIRFGNWRRIRKEPSHFRAADLLEPVLADLHNEIIERQESIAGRSGRQKLLF